MSLFQAKEWWSSKNFSEEDAGYGCLCVANIDNAEDNNCKVITGSYQGTLHIYAPSNDTEHLAHDVLLEINLQMPILQLATGRFNSVSPDLHLAILHPRLLVVYKVSMSEGAVDHGHQYKLDRIYQHKLERTAANMTWGSFGGVQKQDFICVQSMDGALSIFEHELYTFTRFLPGFLLPGPLAYNPRTDSFVTVSSSFFIESYSYQVLAVASEKKEENQSVMSGKRISVDWSFNVGEFILDLVVLILADGKSVIVALGERSLFCLEESGQLRFLKKFEFNVACFKAFPSREGSSVQTLVCTHSQQLMVYDGLVMKWAAKLDQIPVCIATGDFRGVNAMLVLMTDSCQVSCSYLGTSPAMISLPRSKQREMDQNMIDSKMEALNQKIAKLQFSKGDLMLKQQETDDLSISIDVPTSLDRKSVASQISPDLGNIPSITAQILLKASRRVTNIQLSIESDSSLECTLDQFTLASLVESDPSPPIRPSFFVKQDYIPASLLQQVTVHYQQASGRPRVAMATMQLPLTLVARSSAPIKKMDHRVTLESNKPCINLMEIFDDFTCETSGPHCIGFEFFQGSQATILTSKSSNRYRVQGDSYDSLWPVTSELIRRVRSLHPDVSINVQDQPSLEEYNQIVEEHYQLRVQREEIKVVLEQRAHQYRAIQRRLLARFKDKTPAPLNCLDTLLEGTHTQILAVADALAANDASLVHSSCRLSAASRLVALLTQLWRGLGEGEVRSLHSLLCVDQTYNKNNMGWEEMVDSGIASLLRTSLSSKSSGKDALVSSTQNLELPQDTVKLKKHLAVLMDKLAKGGRLPSTASHADVTKSRGSPAKPSSKPVSKKTSPKSESLNSFYDDSPPRKSPDKIGKKNDYEYASIEAMLPVDSDVRLPPKLANLPEINYEEELYTPVNSTTIPNGNYDEVEENLYMNGDSAYETPRDKSSTKWDDHNIDVDSPVYYEEPDIFS